MRKQATAAKPAKAGKKKAMPVNWSKSTSFEVPIPKDEEERMADLRDYAILDTPAEAGFDNLTSLAALICNTPMALISLVDNDRQWFKAKLGVNVSETARNISFCAHAIMHPDVFVVRDACQDPRFASSPLVTGSPKIRFYAGVPIVSPQKHILGTLCVMDRVPRVLTREQTEALQFLSRQVMMQLEMRRELLELRENLTV